MHVAKFFFSYTDNWPRTSAGLPSTAGTTASIAFIRKGKLYTGHCGDSGIVLGHENRQPSYQRRLYAQQLTTDHKPELQAERARIEARGGKVLEKSGIQRVVWYRPKFPHRGPIRRNTAIEEIPFLAVARSLGDLWSYNWFTEEFMVSPEPDVAVININPEVHKCLIFASDGLWNVMDPQDAIDIFHETELFNARNSQSGLGHNWRNPSRYLVQEALVKWGKTRMRSDNITVVTVAIDSESNRNPIVAENNVQAIYDYSSNDCYNLDYMDLQNTSASSYNYQLPSFSNVANIFARPSSSVEAPNANYESNADLTYYCTSYGNNQSAFVKACCQDQRYVLAGNEEVIRYHDNYEHHKQEYEKMLQQKFPPLHYAYRPVPSSPIATNLETSSYITPQRSRTLERFNYIRPTEEEFAEMHLENLEPVASHASFVDDPKRCETPLFDGNESDGEEMDWSDSEGTEKTDGTSEAGTSEDDKSNENKANNEDSIQIHEISSSNLGKELEESETPAQIEINENTPSRKRKSAPARTTSRFYQTRQYDRKTRSSRIINSEATTRSSRSAAKKALKRTESILPKKQSVASNEASTSSSKNKENKNVPNANVSPQKNDQRVLRSSQTDAKERAAQPKPSVIKQLTTVVRNLRNRVNTPSTSTSSEKEKTRKRKIK